MRALRRALVQSFAPTRQAGMRLLICQRHCKIAPRQTSTTSNLSRFASRLSVANLSMAQKQIAPTTTPIKTEILAPSLCCRSLFRLRLQSVDLDFGGIIALAQFCHTGRSDIE